MKIPASILLLLLCQSALAADDYGACAKIKSAVERLDCYDSIARSSSGTPADAKDESKADTKPAPETPHTSVPKKSVGNAAVEPAPSTQHATSPAPAASAPTGNKFGIMLFGEHGKKPEQVERIESSVKDAHKNNVGRYVISLTNGQVWMQREPGHRSIHINQDVVITHRRWSYSMYLTKQNFNVTVQRID